MADRSRSPAAQRGLAIGVILAALVLMALIAGALAITSRDSGNFVPREAFKTRLINQGQLIRQKIARCGLDYPAANNGDANAADITYPVADALTAASGLTCPGTGKPVFDGSDGIFYPQAITGCNAWQYVNNKTLAIPYPNIEIWCQNSAEGRAAISDVYNRFGTGEAQLYTNNAGTPNDTLILFLHK